MYNVETWNSTAPLAWHLLLCCSSPNWISSVHSETKRKNKTKHHFVNPPGNATIRNLTSVTPVTSLVQYPLRSTLILHTTNSHPPFVALSHTTVPLYYTIVNTPLHRTILYTTTQFTLGPVLYLHYLIIHIGASSLPHYLHWGQSCTYSTTPSKWWYGRRTMQTTYCWHCPGLTQNFLDGSCLSARRSCTGPAIS